jgi:hypothetical protein
MIVEIRISRHVVYNIVMFRDGPLSERQIFQRTDGFALYTDTNDRITADLAHQVVPPLPLTLSKKYGLTDMYAQSCKRVEENPGAMRLYCTMKRILDIVPDFADIGKYGVSEEDIKLGNTYAFSAGFGDLEFPWHFSAGLANACVDGFVDENAITSEQKNAFTLHDWANVIGAGWFGRLANNMALTGGGVYLQFGGQPADYDAGALHHKLVGTHIIHPTDPLFTYEQLYEPEEQATYHALDLSKEATHGLRQNMHNAAGTSLGCSVARNSVLLPNETVETNPHVQALLDRGTLRIVPERSTSTHTRATAEWTAIDTTLHLFAGQLEQYENNYGTPRIEPMRFGARCASVISAICPWTYSRGPLQKQTFLYLPPMFEIVRKLCLQPDLKQPCQDTCTFNGGKGALFFEPACR